MTTAYAYTDKVTIQQLPNC